MNYWLLLNVNRISLRSPSFSINQPRTYFTRNVRRLREGKISFWRKKKQHSIKGLNSLDTSLATLANTKSSARWPKGRFFSFLLILPSRWMYLSDSVDYCIDCTHERPKGMRCWKSMNGARFSYEKAEWKFLHFLLSSSYGKRHRHTYMHVFLLTLREVMNNFEARGLHFLFAVVRERYSRKGGMGGQSTKLDFLISSTLG